MRLFSSARSLNKVEIKPTCHFAKQSNHNFTSKTELLVVAYQPIILAFQSNKIASHALYCL